VIAQLVGGSAILLGLYGTWLAAQRRTGWLLCIVSSLLWFPALVSGAQWAAVVNCTVSIGICLRNFRTAELSSQPVRNREVRDVGRG
jgi:hypothetical protein